MKRGFYSTRMVAAVIVVQLFTMFLYGDASFSSNALASGVLLDELDIIGSWKSRDNCSLLIDSSNKASGTGSLKIASSISGGECNAESVFSTPRNLSDLKNIELNVCAADLSAVNTVALFMMTDDANFYYNYFGSWEMISGWNTLRADVSSFGKNGNPSWSSIGKIWIKIENISGKQSVVNIDKISYNVLQDVLLQVDDGQKQLQQTLPDFPNNMSDFKNFEINLTTSDLTSFVSVDVNIMTDSSNFYYNYIGPWEMMRGTNKIRRAASEFGVYGSPSWSNIQKISVKVNGVSGKVPDIKVSSIAYNVVGKTNILFTFDDASSGVYTYAYPVMKANGLVGTTWACKDLATCGDADFMNEATLKKLYSAGWDIGNHSANHVDDVTTLTREQKTNEYKDNLTWLNSLGFSRSAPHVCYPQGSFDDELLSILPTIGVKSGRTTIHGIQAEPMEDIYRLKTVAVGRDTEVSYVKDIVDKAVATGSSIFFMFHDAADSPPTDADSEIIISTAKFTEIVNYIKSLQDAGKLDVPTISQWYEKISTTMTPTPAPTITPLPTVIPTPTATPIVVVPTATPSPTPIIVIPTITPTPEVTPIIIVPSAMPEVTPKPIPPPRRNGARSWWWNGYMNGWQFGYMDEWVE